MRIRTQCRACGYPFSATLAPHTTILPCPSCGNERAVDGTAWTEPAPSTAPTCALCGSRHLYRQKDVNRGLGCLIVAIGAALTPWTYGLSLLACTLIDVWLYRRLPEAVVCYRCDTVYRDARPLPSQGPFELLKHDVVKYGKTWETADQPATPENETARTP